MMVLEKGVSAFNLENELERISSLSALVYSNTDLHFRSGVLIVGTVVAKLLDDFDHQVLDDEILTKQWGAEFYRGKPLSAEFTRFRELVSQYERGITEVKDEIKKFILRFAKAGIVCEELELQRALG